MRILVVDDEPEMTALLTRGLQADGHDVVIAHDGVSALGNALQRDFDVAVVDVMLPGMSGFELSRRLKEHDATTAIILLTARAAVDDRVRGLDSGADDYLVKPFAFAELAARIRAIRRRDALTAPSRLRVASIDIDLHRHRAEVDGRNVPLSRTEFDVLRVLAAAAEATVTRATLLQEVWGGTDHIDPNILEQYVSYLRRKVATPESGARIVTTRGVGYALTTTD